MIGPHSMEIEKIFHSTLGNGTRVIGLASPCSGSGVTSLAVALARRCALGGIQTLLIDMASPVMVDSQASDWTPGRGGVGQEIECDKLGFDRLPVRPSAETVYKFRDPATLREVFSEELTRYDAIIIDLAPVPNSDPAAIPGAIGASACDSVLLVGMTGRITRYDLDAAIDALKATNAPLAGIILNDRDNPTLGAEIAREARRIERFLPRLSRSIQKVANRVRLLNLHN